MQNNKKLLSKTFYRNTNNVQLLFDIFNNKKEELDYNNSGITEINFSINPKYNLVLPLELVFKLIKTSSNVPFVKFNPGKGREKIYRLYADKVSTNGKKIPFLSKASIMKLRANMAKDKSVELFIQDTEQNVKLFINFSDNGIITCQFETNQYATVNKINTILKDKVNDVIDILKDFLEQRGYSFENFVSLTHENISINRILYHTHMTITRNIKLSKYSGCLSSFFNIIDDNLKTGIVLRYKRVSYFNKMESIDAFITEMALQNRNEVEILNGLESNFKLTPDEAGEKYTEWLSNIRVEQQLYENRKLKVKSNPGFPMTITKDKFTNKILISVDNINNIELLNVLPVYIDSIIRLTQNIDSTGVPRSRINRLCGSKELQEQDIVEDLESKLEEKLQVSKGFEFKGDELEDDDLDDDEGLIGLLDEGEDDELIGGGESDEESEGYISLEEATPTPVSSVRSSPQSSKKESVSPDSEALELEEATPTPSPQSSKKESVSPENESLELEDATPTPVSSVRSSPKSSKKESSLSESDDDILELSEGSQLSSASQLQSTPKTNIKLKSASKTPSKTPSKKSSKKPSKKPELIEDNVLEDITGMPLTNPTPFFASMKERDPVLFLQKKDGKFKAYSRSCPSNLRRQPIILTDAEKERIDRESRGSYDHAIKYGSSPDKQYWYICPRYWCLKTNTSMTEEEVKAGKCGGSDKIIPRNAKKVPKDAFVYEFYTDYEHKGADGEYITHNPGFLKESAHPDGLCIPCCFRNWDAPSQKERRDVCINKKEVVKEPEKEVDDYIKKIETFPLSKNRWGELPISIQKLLHTDNNKCFQPGTRYVKKNDPKRCILRKGVEVNKKQSFIGVLADVYPEFRSDIKEIPSIKDMKKQIIKSLDIDKFISYNNGALVSTFEKESLSVNIAKYSSSKLHDKLSFVDDTYKEYFRRICASYENFIDYLKDDDVVIDHTFLWDIVSKPNDNYFHMD